MVSHSWPHCCKTPSESTDALKAEQSVLQTSDCTPKSCSLRSHHSLPFWYKNRILVDTFWLARTVSKKQNYKGQQARLVHLRTSPRSWNFSPCLWWIRSLQVLGPMRRLLRLKQCLLYSVRCAKSRGLFYYCLSFPSIMITGILSLYPMVSLRF